MGRKKNRNKPRGISYQSRVKEVNAIYDQWARTGLSNREIWRRYVWPKFYISEQTFYNYLKSEDKVTAPELGQQQPELFH